jgi:large subunit ribosomal protein L9
MKLILVQDVTDLGQIGDVVDVAPGYARNYLLPRSLGVKATESAMASAAKKRAEREEAEHRLRQEAENLAEALGGQRIVVAARAGDEGKLFGSVGTADICGAVQKFTGIELDRGYLQIGSPIREIGIHEVGVKPHPDVEFNLTLDVIPA